MSIESLKEKARRHEQKEEWQKALDQYLEAIQSLDDEEEQDISLFNRVGDLEVRLGHLDQAVGHYERAVDLYVQSELPNNAIAVCKKVVRNVPDRHAIFLKMGQIRASQGFITDARQNFLTYAERKQAEGDMEEAFRALIEFVELVPDDIEIRLALASQLAQHDRDEEAVVQFREARRRLILDGRDDEAGGVEETIRELAPDVELAGADDVRAAGPDADDLAPAADDDWGMGLSDFVLDDEAEPAVEEAGDEEVEIGAGFADIDAGDEEGEEEAGPLPTMGFDDEAEDEEQLAADLPMMDFGDEAEEEAEPLPTMGFDDEAEDEEQLAADLPMMDFGDEVEDEEEAAAGVEEARGDALEDAAFDLRHEEEDDTVEPHEAGVEEESGLGLDEEADEPADDDWLTGIEAADETTAAVGEDPEALRDEAEGHLDAGRVDEAWPLLERAHEALSEEGRVRDAVAVVRRMTEERPGDVELRQRLVEYAYRTSDEELLVRAYLDLAGTLEQAGQTKKAAAACQQVLDVDPDHAEARELLAELVDEAEPAAASGARSEVASSEEYVDLGSMIFDEEEGEKSTRFVVPAEAPSGDEEADFAKMLTQFKEKVAENVDTDDVSAHHDLGTAYKEMGLLDEAISEFQAALRASRTHLPTYEMLGQCFLEKDQPRAAVQTLSKALEAPFDVEDELLGIYYYLGRAHQELDETDRAVEFYDNVFALDINFMDVTERLRTLR